VRVILRRIGVALALTFVLSGEGLAAATTSVPTTDPRALLIEYTEPTQFSNDAMVMQIRILNRTGRARRWVFELNAPRLSYDDGGRRSRFELEVESGDDRRFEILVPLAGAQEASWVQMAVFGDGVVGAGQMQLVANTVSSTVATSAGATIHDEQARAALLGQFGPGGPFVFDAADLSRHVQAYAGLAALWISAEEWSEADPGIRRVLTEWVAGGGRLVLVESGESLPAAPIRRYGLGAIANVPAGLSHEDVNELEDVVAPANPDLALASWATSLIEPIEIHEGFLSLILLGYLVVAGPVNLLVFSRGANRMRLFWTMPSIAFIATGVMAVVILLQDGVGGSGVRSSLVYLQPELNRELVVQEQVSRTGALLTRSFEIDESVHVTALAISDRTYQDSDRADLVSSGDRYEGDWFRSRSVQAQRLETTRASRARVELVGSEGSQPALLSSIDVPLDELYFRDDSGRVWRAENVVPGRPASLDSATEMDYEQFWREVSFRAAGPRIRRRTTSIHQLPGTFLARAAPDRSDAMFETLASIDWSESTVLYAGPIAGHAEAGRR
jgi:hypothetical protein